MPDVKATLPSLLLSGASGQLGTAVLRAWDGRSRVYTVSRRPPSQGVAASSPGAIEHFAADLLDPEQVARVALGAKDAQACVLLASHIHMGSDVRELSVQAQLEIRRRSPSSAASNACRTSFTRARTWCTASRSYEPGARGARACAGDGVRGHEGRGGTLSRRVCTPAWHPAHRPADRPSLRRRQPERGDRDASMSRGARRRSPVNRQRG